MSMYSDVSSTSSSFYIVWFLVPSAELIYPDCQVSNTFYFTFSLDPEIKAPGVDWNVRRVLPATEEEARTYLARYEADHIVHEVSV